MYTAQRLLSMVDVTQRFGIFFAKAPPIPSMASEKSRSQTLYLSPLVPNVSTKAASRRPPGAPHPQASESKPELVGMWSGS